MNSFYFTEEHDMFRQSLKSFLAKEVIPNIDQWEEEQRIPKSIWKKMGEQGYLGLGYDQKYGGSELDFFFDVIFCEETSKVYSGGFAISQIVTQYMSGPYIAKYGSEELKEKYLPGIISGDLMCSIGISEPTAGSDAAAIKTTAVKDGDYYVINGSKTFITNAVYGDFIVTVVKTDPSAGAAGVSLIVIDRNAEGVSATKLKKLGWHASDTAELAFDNVRVPAMNLIGEEGRGFYYLMGGLQLERLVGAVMGHASCEAAMEYTLQYMSERQAFGRPINKFQVLRHRMAQLAAEIECCKQFVYHCSRIENEGQYAVKECSMAKLIASELADKVMYQCLQSFGGYGFMEEYKIARMFRDSRVGTIGAGTSEIMREIIAKMVIDDVSYQSANDTHQKSNSASANGAAVKQESSADGNGSLLSSISAKAANVPAIGSTLKFDFDDEQILINGTGDENIVTLDDGEADCVIHMSKADFAALNAGELNAMGAVMSGKIKIKGDMSLAMKLQSLLG